MPKEVRILVVSREPEWRTFLSKALRQAGYVLDSADSIPAALQKITPNKFDLIIVDALLIELLQALIAANLSQRLLVVTNAPSVSEAILAYRWGALDYVDKAFEASTILATVADVLQKQPVQQHLLVR